MLWLRRFARMGCGGFLILEYQKSSAATPHTRWVFAANMFARNQTSEATSDADFGEGLRAGDDFWYSSMRNLP